MAELPPPLPFVPVSRTIVLLAWYSLKLCREWTKFSVSDAEVKHGEVGSGHLNPLGLDYRRLSVSERGMGIRASVRSKRVESQW